MVINYLIILSFLFCNHTYILVPLLIFTLIIFLIFLIINHPFENKKMNYLLFETIICMIFTMGLGTSINILHMEHRLKDISSKN